jgi:thiosulfate/3-mercaptopyruvate sulfurtransferase
MSEDIVSTEWLAAHLGSPDIAILDGSWHLPAAKRDAKAEFLEGHIPGAQFFDLDDTVGLFSAARIWWMFKAFGHADVAVLDGGLAKWKAEGRPLEDGPAARPQERHFTARFQASMVSDLADVRKALSDNSAQLADARSPTRFRGEEPEPRPGVRPGHMPGARNVHYATLLRPDGTLKSAAAIADVFKAAGVDLAKPVITSCGSGVTAAILSLGLTLAGARDHRLYDGSWAEWGAADTPVATGA